MEQSGTGVLVFAIVTRNNPKPDPLSLRLGEFKFDFFVMSRRLGQRYHKLQPVLEDSTCIRPEPLLARWAEIRGRQARADWALLRQIDGLGALSLREFSEGEQAGLWLTTQAQARERAIHVLLYKNGALRLFLGRKEAPEQECLGPWTQPEIGPHIFVSHLLLTALEELRDNPSSPKLGRHFASLMDDRQRLVAEARAMRERFGNDPQLRHEYNELFWRCAARQSGRELPLQILYGPGYPFAPPTLVSQVELKSGCPHLLPGNKLCWLDYGTDGTWNPGRDTAATALVAAQRWFACYLVWLTNGVWPQPINH